MSLNVFSYKMGIKNNYFALLYGNKLSKLRSKAAIYVIFFYLGG